MPVPSLTGLLPLALVTMVTVVTPPSPPSVPPTRRLAPSLSAGGQRQQQNVLVVSESSVTVRKKSSMAGVGQTPFLSSAGPRGFFLPRKGAPVPRKRSDLYLLVISPDSICVLVDRTPNRKTRLYFRGASLRPVSQSSTGRSQAGVPWGQKAPTPGDHTVPRGRPPD